MSRTMKPNHDLERSLPPAAAQPSNPGSGIVIASRRRPHESAALATYRDLGAKGLAPAEAGNLTAYLRGLRPMAQGWTVAEIDRILFLRYLVDRGRIDGHPVVDSTHPVRGWGLHRGMR